MSQKISYTCLSLRENGVLKEKKKDLTVQIPVKYEQTSLRFTICTAGPPLFHVHIARYFKGAFA